MTSPERQRGELSHPSLALRAGRNPILRFFWTIFFVLTFLHLLRFPTAIHGPGLDESWQQCLGYFLLHRFQAGVDYVWTYGPLGYFATQSYNGDLFWWKYAWEIVVNLILAGLLTGVGGRLPSRLLQIAYVPIVLVTEPRWDTFYLVALAWPVVLVLRTEKLKKGVLAALGFWLAVLALVKFTWLLLAALAWVLVIVGCWRERGRRFEVVFSFPIAVVAIWLALGQSPWHFGPYLAASWQIAIGYGEAMATDGPSWRVWLALIILVLLAILAAILARSTGRKVKPLVGFVLLGVSVLLAWKHGFTRQPSHDVLFFSFVVLVPFAGAALSPPGRIGLGLTTAIVALALIGRGTFSPADWCNHLVANTHDLVTPLALRERCQQQYEALAAEWALPRLSAIIGEETVDQLSSDQGVVLLNRWNYRPRPVFQGYSAYTPRLLDDNAAFFRGERAPRFVLWRLDALDDRLPTSEDGPALLEILYCYRLVAEEHGFQLLERRTSQPTITAAREVLWTGTAGFNEEVSLGGLPGAAHIVRIQVVDSARGKLTKLLFRPPPLFLRVRQTDGEESRYRLIPALVSAGFLLNPLLRDDEDVRRWFVGEKMARVAAFSVKGSAEARSCYGDSIRIVIERDGEPDRP